MVTAKDITAAKAEARDEHINDDGTTNAAHIFAHVPELLGVTEWHHDEEMERDGDYEHAWQHDDRPLAAVMFRANMGWRVVAYERDGEVVSSDFGFAARKAAEAFLIDLMLHL